VLLDLQRGRCFYCNGALQPANTHVDHFVAWARYPVNLGHNLVLADNRCNAAKRDRLPARDHLTAWRERNARFGDQIGKALEERGIVSQLGASNRVAQWAYGQTEAAHGLTWLKADEIGSAGAGVAGTARGRVIRRKTDQPKNGSVATHRYGILKDG
jgi:hypothetical protein